MTYCTVKQVGIVRFSKDSVTGEIAHIVAASKLIDEAIDGRLEHVATFEDLTAGDPVEAGQSVMRHAEGVVLYREDGLAQADDQLLVPPDALRIVAVGLARRLLRRQRDETIELTGNLLEGYEALLALYDQRTATSSAK